MTVTIVRAPIDQQLPFGTPVSKTVPFGKTPSLNAPPKEGVETVDALQLNRIELFQSESMPPPDAPIVGFRMSWWSRSKQEFRSPVVGMESKRVPGFINIPYGSKGIVVKGCVNEAGYFVGFQVEYVAPNTQTFAQTLVPPQVTEYSTLPIPLREREVVTGIPSFYTNPNTNGILSLQMQVSELPFGVQHSHLTPPIDVVNADVIQTDDLVQQEVDNSESTLLPLTAVVALTYNYSNEYSAVDTSISGWAIKSVFTTQNNFEVDFFLASEGISFKATASFEYNQTAQKDITETQTTKKTYTADATVTVPAGQKRLLSLTAFKMASPEDVTFQVAAKATYYWYSYIDGSVVTSPLIDTTLQLVNIKHTQYFTVSQGDADGPS